MKRCSHISTGIFFITLITAGLFIAIPHTTYAQAHYSYTEAANELGGAVSALASPLDTMMNWLATKFANFLIWISGSFLWLGGKLLDASIQFNVCDSKTLMGTAAVSQGWLIARNIANFFFIFILLYIAISIILNIGESQKKLVVWVVIIALIINFSAVFTRFVIDVSNVFAYQFYSSIVGGEDPCTTETSNASGITANYMTALNLQSYAVEESSDKSLYQGTTGTAGTMVAGIMTAIFIMVTAWSFIVAAILMIIRSAVLMILIVLSPIAFIGCILPQTKKVMSQWWGALASQAFFAPVYLFFAYVSLTLTKGTVALFQQETFASGTEQLFKIFMQYSLFIAIIVFGLVQAKKMSSAGAGAVQGRVLKSLDWMRGQATGAVGRNTVGRVGRMIADSDKVKRGASGAGGVMGKVMGIPLKNAGNAMAGGKYGGGKSYDDIVKKQIERAKGVKNPIDRARILGGMSITARKEYFDSLSDREKAETLEAAKNIGGLAGARAEGQKERLNTEQLEKVEKAGGEGKDAARKKEQSSTIETVTGNTEKNIAGLAKGSPERKEQIEKVVSGLKDDEGRKLAKIVEDADDADIDAMYAKMNPLDVVDLIGHAKLSNEAKDKLRKGMSRLGNDHPTFIELHSNPKLKILFGEGTRRSSGTRPTTPSPSTPSSEAYIG